MASTVLSELPSSAVLVLLNHVVALSNTGQLVRLAVASRDIMGMVARADWFWQQQCEQLGWLRPGVYHPPTATAPSAYAHPIHQQPKGRTHHCQQHLQQQPPADQHDDHLQQQQQVPKPVGQTEFGSGPWFKYYTLRMTSRWRLRTLMKKYIPFLNIQSRLALLPGASVDQLSAVEERLQMPLPWQLWELYRFRSGQDPGQGVVFADTCRLLALNELHTVRIIVAAAGGPSLAPVATQPQTEQQLTILQQQTPGLLHVANDSCNSSSSGSKSRRITSHASVPQDDHFGCSGTTPSSEAIAGVGCGGSCAAGVTAAVVFLSNTVGSVSYAICPEGLVYILRGFTQIRVAGNLSAFLQHLLM